MVPFESSSKLIILLDLNTLFSEDIFIFTNLLLLFFNKTRFLGVYIINILLVLFFVIHIDMFLNFQFFENIVLNKLAMTLRLVIQVLFIYFINSFKSINL